MGWETRKNGLFYYAKRRKNGRVVSTYYGSGDTAAFVADFQEQESAFRAFGMAAERALSAERRVFDGLCRDVANQCRDLAAMLLLADGYHQHKGQWRKRRMTKKKASDTDRMPLPPAEDDTSSTALGVLMRRCNTPMALSSDISALRRLIVSHYPHMADLGDMLEMAISKVSSGEGMRNSTGLTVATVEANAELRKKELGYDTASPLEKPLILHLVLCEQRLGIVETVYGQQMKSELTLKQADYWERRVNHVQQRYLKAVETLAKIRRVRIEAWQSDGVQATGVAVERSG